MSESHADLWAACSGDLRPAPLDGELLRVVESQEQVATTGLVDDLAEQSVLEELLESSKPPRRAGTRQLHYLLASPFRYPPLRHGSRFGSRYEPSLFYGARDTRTALAESAYYRFVFWTAMREAPASGRLLTQHTIFRVRIRAAGALRLHEPPCARYEEVLRHPFDYRPTQALGRALRDLGADAIEYRSARDLDGGLNVGLFEPSALASRRPLDPRPWLCETRAERVNFSGELGREVFSFPLSQFLVAGQLPLPAG